MKSSYKISILTVVLFVLLATACKEPPEPEITACFTLQNDTFLDPKQPVQFLNCSQGATSYYWSFGDGTYSAEESPAHLFNTIGRFNVHLAAINGDFQETFTWRIRVDYPRFKKVRILQMPVLNRYGVPYDLDGNGLDLAVSLTRAGEHFFAYATIDSNLTLPHEFNINYDLNINSYWWTVELGSISSGAFDTIAFGSLPYEDLIDSPIEESYSDSLKFEIIMEGAK